MPPISLTAISVNSSASSDSAAVAAAFRRVDISKLERVVVSMAVVLTSPRFTQLMTTPAFSPTTPPAFVSACTVPPKTHAATTPPALLRPTTPPTLSIPAASPSNEQRIIVPLLSPTTPPTQQPVPPGVTVPATARSVTTPSAVTVRNSP